MTGKAGLLLAGVALLVAAATATFAPWGAPASGPGANAREFQHLVRGLGFGPAVSPEGCEFDFDPRLCPACPFDTGPVPGGVFFCPHHGCSVLEHRPLPANP